MLTPWSRSGIGDEHGRRGHVSLLYLAVLPHLLGKFMGLRLYGHIAFESMKCAFEWIAPK